MPQKYHKLSKKDQKLKPPLEYQFIKLSALGLVAFLITLLATSAFAPIQPTEATSSTTNLQATISSTPYYLTLSSSGTSLNIGATPGGALSAAMDTVKVKTNNPYGYQLYLSTNSSNNRLYLDGDTTKTYFSPTSGTFLNPQPLSLNSWGYALAESDAGAIRDKLSQTAITHFNDTYSTMPSDDSVWAAVPIKGNDQLIKSTTGADETGVDTNVYYAAKASTALAPGTYTGTVLYTVIAETGAASNTATVAPSTIDADTPDQTIVISTSLPANAELIGDVVVTIGTDYACTVTSKSNNAATTLIDITCTAPSLAAGTYDITVDIPFYDKTYTITDGITYKDAVEYMQNFTAEKCNTLTKNTDIITLVDKRDNNEYTVRKLADNNCWMTTNLMLGNTITSSGSITINSTNSQVASDTSFEITSANIKTASSGSWSNDDYDVLHIYARQPSEKESNGNVYGNLYNYYTATAKSGSRSTTSGDASYSICPSGWRLPTKVGNPSYANLFNTSTANGGLGYAIVDSGTNNVSHTNAMDAAPYNISHPGMWFSGKLNYLDFSSVYLIRTAYSADNIWAFNVRTDGVYYFYNASTGKNLGGSVRCVFSNN